MAPWLAHPGESMCQVAPHLARPGVGRCRVALWLARPGETVCLVAPRFARQPGRFRDPVNPSAENSKSLWRAADRTRRNSGGFRRPRIVVAGFWTAFARREFRPPEFEGLW